MLILNGNCGKSRVIDIIMDKTNSICFVYNDQPLIFNAICVDSREYFISDFLECISETLKESVINDEHYDYLLVYTNQEEEYLQDIVYWLNKYQTRIPCRDIILACK